MPFGAPARVQLSFNRPKWRIESLHDRIQAAVRIGLSDDLPLTRRLISTLFQRASVPAGAQVPAAVGACFDFLQVGNGGALRGECLSPTPAVLVRQRRQGALSVPQVFRLPPFRWTGLCYVTDPTWTGAAVADRRHVDLYQTLARSIELGCGDCVAYVIGYGTLLKSIGFRVAVAYAAPERASYNHVYALVSGPAPGNTRAGIHWTALDGTNARATPGWAPVSHLPPVVHEI